MEPLYYKIKRDIEERINRQQYKKGDYLPSEPELQEYYKVSRTTIRKTISMLVDEGMVTIVRGKGTKVTPSKLSHKISVLMSFTEIMKQQGLHPAIKDFSVTRVKPLAEITAKLDLGLDDEVYEIYRVRTADNEPISINRSYIPCKHLPFFDPELLADTQSLYSVLEDHYNLSIQMTEDAVTAVKAGPIEAKALDINRNDPLLCIERLAYDKSNTPVEFSKIFIRSDRYKHIITLRKR